MPASRAGVQLGRALRALAREGLTSLLVEGGGVLAAALLRDRLVDEVHWIVSPRLLGGDGRPALGPLGLARLAGAPQLEELAVRRLGGDLWLRGRPSPASSGRMR